jgi:hypothetical protein
MVATIETVVSRTIQHVRIETEPVRKNDMSAWKVYLTGTSEAGTGLPDFSPDPPTYLSNEICELKTISKATI